LLTRARKVSIKRKGLFTGNASAALSARQFEALRKRILGFNKTIVKAQPAQEAKPE
jgi:hypothetical protein